MYKNKNTLLKHKKMLNDIVELLCAGHRTVETPSRTDDDHYICLYKKDSSILFDQGQTVLDQMDANGSTIYVVTQSNQVAVVRSEGGVHHINGWLPRGSIIGIVTLQAPILYVSTVERCELIRYSLVVDLERALTKERLYRERAMVAYKQLSDESKNSVRTAVTGVITRAAAINAPGASAIDRYESAYTSQPRGDNYATAVNYAASIYNSTGILDMKPKEAQMIRCHPMASVFMPGGDDVVGDLIVTRHIDVTIGVLQLVRGFAHLNVSIEKLAAIINYRNIHGEAADRDKRVIEVDQKSNRENFVTMTPFTTPAATPGNPNPSPVQIEHAGVDDVFFLMEGKADVIINGTPVNVYEPMVSVFGEKAIIYPGRPGVRGATIRADGIGGCVALKINIPRLLKALSPGQDKHIENFDNNAFERQLDPAFKAIRMGLLEHISETNALNASHTSELEYRRIVRGVLV
jgi:mannose-6-phosphate isomerase-like protein (cupin superfamily)